MASISASLRFGNWFMAAALQSLIFTAYGSPVATAAGQFFIHKCSSCLLGQRSTTPIRAGPVKSLSTLWQGAQLELKSALPSCAFRLVKEQTAERKRLRNKNWLLILLVITV